MSKDKPVSEFIIDSIYCKVSIVDKLKELYKINKEVVEDISSRVEAKICEELEKACKLSNRNEVKILLDTGIDVENQEEYMNAAVFTGDKDIINMLKRRGAKASTVKIEKQEDEIHTDEEQLLIAIKSGDREVINEYLNDRNRNINVADNHNKSALMYAIEKKDEETIEKLLKRNVNVYAVDDKKKSVLMYAINNKNIKLVEQLISKGVDLEAKDKYNTSVLMYALKQGESMSFVIDMLIDNLTREEANYANKKGTSLLMCACLGGYMKAVDKLIELGADVNAVDLDGYAPAGIALIKGNTELARYLIKKGAIALGEAAKVKSREFYKLLDEVTKNIFIPKEGKDLKKSNSKDM